MQIDLILACLAIVLGAIIFYALDEIFTWTPRLSVWIDQRLDE